MSKSNAKKSEQLGMSFGTASNRLKKMILFALVKSRSGLDRCYRCGESIESVEELSIEHKEPWLDSDNPKELFFDLQNIAFSHLSCNVKVARRKCKYETTQERSEARKESSRKSSKKYCTKEKRREKYVKTGW